MGPLWQTFVSSLEVYQRSSIGGAEDPYDGRYDSDGAEKSLESFVIQVNIILNFESNRLAKAMHLCFKVLQIVQKCTLFLFFIFYYICITVTYCYVPA